MKNWTEPTTECTSSSFQGYLPCKRISSVLFCFQIFRRCWKDTLPQQQNSSKVMTDNCRTWKLFNLLQWNNPKWSLFKILLLNRNFPLKHISARHAFNPRTQKTEIRRSQTWSQPRLNTETSSQQNIQRNKQKHFTTAIVSFFFSWF